MSHTDDTCIEMNKSDEEAQRLLSIAVLFENAQSPLSTDAVHRTIYSYCDSDESARKAFMRDREKLILCGLNIRRTKGPDGSSAWALDGSSLPGQLNLTSEEAATLSISCAPLINDPAFPYSNDLRLALVKINQSFDTSPGVSTNAHTREIDINRSKLETCAANNHPARITYQKAHGGEVTRTVGVCGFFSLRGNTYVVAQRIDSPEAPHSYNLGRLKSVTPLNGKTFVVPQGFDIRSYMKLPFQMGEGLYTAEFSVPESEVQELRAHNLGQGVIEPGTNGSFVWKVEVSSTQRAAAWAIANALQPLSPQELIDSWAHLLEESTGNGNE